MVTRPTLFSAATLVHFIGKSKVKVASFIGINATVNNISAMMYNMAFSFIGV
jgi:hypothetical protein